SLDVGSIRALYQEILQFPALDTRARLLARLAYALPKITLHTEGIAETLASALHEARRLKQAESRVRALVALAPHLKTQSDGTPNLSAQNSLYRYALDDVETAHSDALK